MSIKVFQSNENSAAEAVKNIKESFNGLNPKVVIYFSSSKFDPHTVSSSFADEFPGVETFGCTTSGELSSGNMYKDSIVAMALEEDKVKNLKVEVIEKLSEGIDVDKNVESINNSLFNFKDLNVNEYYGLILVDGLSGAEEKLMDVLGTKTNIQIVGASAGDDLKFEKTHVMHNGKVYTNSAILAVIESAVKFDFIKTQSFKVTDKVLVPTKVNEANREVVEFNHKPALEAYSEALNVSKEEAAKLFMKHPVGLMVGDEPYVRSPQMALENGAMKFFCNVTEGMELKILESTNIVEDTKKVIMEKNNGSDKVSGIINFNCILRTLELEINNQTEEYGKIFSDIPTVGFSTYGEEYIGHINQTATMLVLN